MKSPALFTPVEASFAGAAVNFRDMPADGLPELALVGRSNVGKSSLINALVGRSGLARTSNTPGRTQTLNFYRVQLKAAPAAAFYFVDLPGYGFAKVSKAMRHNWRIWIENYLQRRVSLAGVIQVVDFRHVPTVLDIQMFDWLRHYNYTRLVVAAKADKIPRSHREKHRKQILTTLAFRSDEIMVPFSAQSGLGRSEVWDWLLANRDLVGGGAVPDRR